MTRPFAVVFAILSTLVSDLIGSKRQPPINPAFLPGSRKLALLTITASHLDDGKRKHGRPSKWSYDLGGGAATLQGQTVAATKRTSRNEYGLPDQPRLGHQTQILLRI